MSAHVASYEMETRTRKKCTCISAVLIYLVLNNTPVIMRRRNRIVRVRPSFFAQYLVFLSRFLFFFVLGWRVGHETAKDAELMKIERTSPDQVERASIGTKSCPRSTSRESSSRDIVVAAAATSTHRSRLNQSRGEKGELDKTKGVAWNLYRRAAPGNKRIASRRV